MNTKGPSLKKYNGDAMIQLICYRLHSGKYNYLGQNPSSALKAVHKAISLRKALIPLLTINPSWTSVKETSCEANKYNTLNCLTLL